MQAAHSSAREAFIRFERWMLEDALPFWSSAGLSPDGGVVERMTLAGLPDRPGFKRVRVHARQLYVYSHAHCIGVPGMLDAAQAAFAFLLQNGRSPLGGWVVKMGEGGGIVDDERDLYDQAFVILAMAWFAKASGDVQPIAIARETLAMIERTFAREDGRGYLSRLPDSGQALQNPHMHLFEAVLALHEIAPDPASAAACAHLRDHFASALFDPLTGTLGEVFAMDWQFADGPAGQLVEPGHHYEWAWLLEMAEKLGFGTAEPAAGKLFAFAEDHGLVSGSGESIMIHDGVNRSGGLVDAAHRSWPQTERLKALAVRGVDSGNPDYEGIAGALNALWFHHIEPAAHGCWIDHVDCNLNPVVAAVPASTLYHLFLAYAELSRCAGSLFGKHIETVQPA